MFVSASLRLRVETPYGLDTQRWARQHRHRCFRRERVGEMGERGLRQDEDVVAPRDLERGGADQRVVDFEKNWFQTTFENWFRQS